MTTIISGTNRKNSRTYLLSTYYQKILTELGHKSTIFSLDELPIDIINTDLYGQRSKGFEPIQKLITATNKFIFVIPEYNGSFPGVLKTFIDCCEFPISFSGKKAALVGHSSGKYGNIRGIEHFTGICHYIGLEVLPLKIHISQIALELNADGEIFREDTVKFIKQQAEKFLKF